MVRSVARDLKPHYLCAFLFELASEFSKFWENCPVLQAPTDALKLSRLALARLVGETLRIGLADLLGIATLEEM